MTFGKLFNYCYLLINEAKNVIKCTGFFTPFFLIKRDNRKAMFHDNDSASSDWTTSTSGCEMEEPITLEEVRDHMCFYVFCCGLCFD